MKKFLFAALCILLIFLIYFFTKDNKTFYVKISDNDNYYDRDFINYLKHKNKLEKAIVYHNLNNYRIVDLLNDINNSKTIKYKKQEYTFTNLLIKADVLVLDIGHDDLLYFTLKDYDMYQYINDIIDDFDKLMELIRNYCKERIFIVFDYDISDEYKSYFFDKLKVVTKKYYISIINKNKFANYLKNIY